MGLWYETTDVIEADASLKGDSGGKGLISQPMYGNVSESRRMRKEITMVTPGKKV